MTETTRTELQAVLNDQLPEEWSLEDDFFSSSWNARGRNDTIRI